MKTRWIRRWLAWGGALAAGLAGATGLWAAPSISGFNQLYGAAADPTYILIYGSGFSPNKTLSVTFNGVAATQAYAVSASTIQTQPPATAPLGPGPVVVTVDGLSVQSAQDFYVVGAGPYVSGFSPTVGADAVTVTLNGEHFGGATSVTFNGMAATHVYANPNVLTAVTPLGVTTGPIKVTTPNGSYTTTSNYFVPPVITGFSPVAGRAGTNVTLTGANFLGATTVSFNGLAVAVTPTSDTSLQVVVPVGITTGPIRIDTPGGAFTTKTNFLVLPLITSFSPDAGVPNTYVVIQGENLADGAPMVTFNGVAAVVQPGYVATQITAKVPAAATTGPITVTTTNGTAVSPGRSTCPPPYPVLLRSEPRQVRGCGSTELTSPTPAPSPSTGRPP